MKHKPVKFNSQFAVILGNRRSQATQMVLPPGESEGGSDNKHRGADQWLFVVSGRGQATINRRKVALRDGVLILIEKGDTHQIKNTGRKDLVTLNFYVPPAYTPQGDELPRGRP